MKVKIRNGIAEVLKDGKIFVHLSVGLALSEECTFDSMCQAVRFAIRQEIEHRSFMEGFKFTIPISAPNWSYNYAR